MVPSLVRRLAHRLVLVIPFAAALLCVATPGFAASDGHGSSQKETRERGRWKTDGKPLFVTDTEPVQVPEPATVTLLGSGLAAMAMWKRRRRGFSKP